MENILDIKLHFVRSKMIARKLKKMENKTRKKDTWAILTDNAYTEIIQLFVRLFIVRNPQMNCFFC